MKVEDLKQQFSGKQRTVADLARYIRNRTDDHSNYCLLMGAGCSVTSGIRPASDLIRQWREQSCLDMGLSIGVSEDTQVAYLKEHASSWYNPTREYSSLFERHFDLQRQRRVFVESEVAGKSPSIGYAYLTALVEQKFFNTIFTTNFDDLINEAFYLFSSERPIICAHDSSINSVTVTSKRPKVIKLHGDYLFDDLKSTLTETESLEQNMKAKFAEFSKDHGFIVVGYSGADRSIMDNLQALLRNEDYLKSGIYWCVRENSEISEDLRKLLFRDRVYYVVVSGFDELFAELYSIFHSGQCVPDAALGINRRSSDALQLLLNSPTGVPATTEVLRRARARLEKYTKRSAIANLMTSENDRPSVGGTEMTDDELLQLSEVSELISSERYELALERARKELLDNPRPLIKRRLLEQCIGAYVLKGDYVAAVAAADEIISMHPNRAASYMRKHRLLLGKEAKQVELRRAIDADEYAVEPRVAMCDGKLSEAKKEYGERRKILLQEAYEAGECAIRLDPAASNPAWVGLFDVIELKENNKRSREEELTKLVNRVAEQNPYSICVLEMRRRIGASKGEDAKKNALKDLLKEIDVAEQRYSDDYRGFSRIRLKTLRDLGDEKQLAFEISKLSNDIDRDPDLAALVAKILREVMGDDQKAIQMLRESLRSSQFDWEVLTLLISALCDVGEIEEAQKLIEKWGHRLPRLERHRMALVLLEARQRYDECLKEVLSFASKNDTRDVRGESYYLLCAEEAVDAEKMLRELLVTINYTPEAEVDIVNLELARKINGAKPDQSRLQKVLDITSSHQTRVGVYAVLDRKQELLEAIKAAVREDKTAKYLMRRWPTMKPHIALAEVREILSPASPVSSVG